MPEMTTTQKCRACIDTGTLGPEGECTDPAHQVAPVLLGGAVRAAGGKEGPGVGAGPREAGKGAENVTQDAAPADLREAIVSAIDRHEIVWVDHDTGWECGCNEHGDGPLMPTRADAVHHIADAVLPIVQAHAAAVRQQAWTEGGRAGAVEASRAAALDAEATWQRFVRQLRSRADQIAAGGEQRG